MTEQQPQSPLPPFNLLETRVYNGVPYFVVNNPFYVSSLNRHQKYRKFCFWCGAERFTDERIKKQDFWAISEMINLCNSCRDKNSTCLKDIGDEIGSHLWIIKKEISDEQWAHMKTTPHIDNDCVSLPGYTPCPDCVLNDDK